MQAERKTLMEILVGLRQVFPTVEFTNIDATGKAKYGGVWIFEKNRPRRGNVWMEVWDRRKNENSIYIVMQKYFMTKEDSSYCDENAKVSNQNRATLVYPYIDEENLFKYIRSKVSHCLGLDDYYHFTEKEED